VFKDLPDVTPVFNDLDELRLIHLKGGPSGTSESNRMEFSNVNSCTAWTELKQPCTWQAMVQPARDSFTLMD